MFLDASAIVAIVGGEDDSGYYLAKIEATKKPVYYSSLSVFETVIALARIVWHSKEDGNDQKPLPADVIDLAREDVAEFLELIGAKEMSIHGSMHRKALDAAVTYGRFVAHPARLNFGDCFSYACAKDYRLPLLFKGNDFSQTDIDAA